jgi:WD40 repeat protein
MAARSRRPIRRRIHAAGSGGKPATEHDVDVRVFEGHRGAVVRVVMPADGRFALTSSEDRTVRRWQLSAGRERSTIVFKGDRFLGLAVTADGSRAATGDGTGRIHLVDLSSGRLLRAWETRDGKRIDGVAFLREGRELLSTAANRSIVRWATGTGRRLASGHLPFLPKPHGVPARAFYGVAASADGRRIVGAAFDEGLALWPGLNGAKTFLLREHVGYHSPVALADDGRYAFTGTQDGRVTRWDLSEHRRVGAFEGHRGQVCALAVTPDGRFCVSGGFDASVRLWAAETGQCLAILTGHLHWVLGVAVSADARRIASVSLDRRLRVWDIPGRLLAGAATAPRRGYVNAKVVLLGEAGVGKTGLALRLWHDRWDRTESSHGMEIRRLELPRADGIADVEREVWLWDLAGQPDYRLTHQLFMEQTSLALLVFDPQDPRVFETVGYWQNALRKVARAEHVPGILVAARCDRPGLRLTMGEVSAWAKSRGLHGPLLTAAKLTGHPGVTKLRDLISELLPWDRLEFRSTMENFPPLRDAILAVRETTGAGGVVVKPEELEARVRSLAPGLVFSSDDLRAVTGLLAGEGVLYALPYGQLVVLQPSWVNCYASTLVKLAGEAENQLGHVPLAVIQPGRLPDDGTPRLSLEDERQLLPALVAVFLERALAWQQDTDKGAMLVFPNYVRLPRPEPPPRPGRTVVYRFGGPLEEIYCTLAVRLRYSGLFARTKLYRQAVDFQTATGKLAALTMREDGERGELEIYFGAGLDADVQASFQWFVHDHLAVKATGLERLRNFFCPRCQEEATDRRAIDQALAKGRTKIVCAYCDPDDRPGMIDLHDVLERQFASKAGEEGADDAGRKAGESISTASMEQVMVGEVMTIVASANQAFIPRVVRDEGTDGEIEFFTKAGESTGVAFRVQLKSGDSHLTTLKDGTEKFAMKKHYERYWAGEKTVPVLLIIRTSDGRTRYTNATQAIRAAQKAKPGKPVTQIVFTGEDFTKEAVLRLRDARLK